MGFISTSADAVSSRITGLFGGANNTSDSNTSKASFGLEQLSMDKIGGYYRVDIDSSKYASGPKAITCRSPQTFSISVQSSWEPPTSVLSGISPTAGKIQEVARFAAQEGFGASVNTQKLSKLVWTGSSRVSITLDLEFIAMKDAEKEVLNPIAILSQMALPTLDTTREVVIAGKKTTVKGLLSPPGPRYFSDVLSNEGGEGDIISVSIGKYINITPLILTSINPVYDNKFDKYGRPMKALVSATFITPYSITSNDFMSWFSN